MTSRRKLASWLTLSAVTTCGAQGCGRCDTDWCCDYNVVNIDSDEYLPFEWDTPTPSEAPFSLMVLAVHDSGTEIERSAKFRYTAGEGLMMNGWAREGWARVPFPPGKHKWCVEPEELTLFLDVVDYEWNVVDGFPTEVVEGGATEAELWDGWTISFEWTKLLVLGWDI